MTYHVQVKVSNFIKQLESKVNGQKCSVCYSPIHGTRVLLYFFRTEFVLRIGLYFISLYFSLNILTLIDFEYSLCEKNDGHCQPEDYRTNQCDSNSFWRGDSEESVSSTGCEIICYDGKQSHSKEALDGTPCTLGWNSGFCVNGTCQLVICFGEFSESYRHWFI